MKLSENSMRWVRMQIAGVCVAVVTGVLAMLLATFAGGILGVLDLMGMTGDPANSPLIGAGRNGVIFSIVIVVLGFIGIYSAKWCGLGLSLCAVVGLLFGPKDPTVSLLVLLASVLCLVGWWKEKGSVQSGT